MVMQLMDTEYLDEEVGEPNPQNPEGEGLSDDTVAQIIAEESQETERNQEAESNENTEQPPQEDIYTKAVESLTSEPSLDYVDRGYFENRLAQAIEELKAGIVDVVVPKPEETEPNVDVESERALEMMLSEGADLSPEEMEAAKARYRHFKGQAKEEVEDDSWKDEVNYKLDQLINRPQAIQTVPNSWSDEEVMNINGALVYLTKASGLNFNLEDPQQAGALIQGLTPGQDQDAAIQQINANINQIKNRITSQQTPENTTAAQVPAVGGVPTSQDIRTFQSREELLIAIEDGEVPLEDYERLVATI